MSLEQQQQQQQQQSYNFLTSRLTNGDKKRNESFRSH